MRPVLIVFVKEPRPGRVKTRLARDIGRVEAAWWFRHESARLLRRLGGDRRWRTVLAVTPEAEGLSSRAWPALPRIAQGRGDIGRRMLRCLSRAGPAPAVLIGADIPGVEPRHVARAFRLLAAHDVVLGPAADGGFWLIGAGRRRLQEGLLDGVRWSTAQTLHDTVQRLGRYRVACADTLADVDTAADLHRIRRRT